jgi:hypothetical protein
MKMRVGQLKEGGYPKPEVSTGRKHGQGWNLPGGFDSFLDAA